MLKQIPSFIFMRASCTPFSLQHMLSTSTIITSCLHESSVKKLILKEVQNLTLNAIILKQYLAARPQLCDVIPSNLKLMGSRKTYNCLGIPHKVSKMPFSTDYPLHSFWGLEHIWLEIIWLSHNVEW